MDETRKTTTESLPVKFGKKDNVNGLMNGLVNGLVNVVENEKQSLEESDKEKADDRKIKSSEEFQNGDIDKKEPFKKGTCPQKSVCIKEEEHNHFKKMEDSFEKEEVRWKIQYNDNEDPEKEEKINDHNFQNFSIRENYYKQREKTKESLEKFEKLEHAIDTHNEKQSIFLNEEEIRKILIEGETNGYKDIHDIHDIEKIDDINYRDAENKIDICKVAYEKSLENYNNSSFVQILNSMNDRKLAKTQNETQNETQNVVLQTKDILDVIKIENKNYVNKNINSEMTKNDVCVISCIMCGHKIKSNVSKMCNNCLLQNIEVTSVNINKDTYIVYFCRDCKRYLHNRWVFCELESKELLALCLKKVAKLKKLKIKGAKFLYTEPHSKRLKIQLSVQEELINNFISEMDIVLHYTIKYTQCDECKKKYTPHTYNTCVSVRQKVEHKKTLLFLENLILQNNMNENVINIVSKPDGLDFHFNSKTDGLKFCDFILAKTISKCKASKHLITHDVKNNTYNYKYNYAIDICPVCKYDLIFIDKDLANKYGIKSFFYLCIHARVYIMLIHPFSVTNNVYVSQEKYHKHPFMPILSMADAKIFLILNVEYIEKEQSKGGCPFKGAIMNSHKKNKFKKKRGKKGSTFNDTSDDNSFRESKRLRLKRRKKSFEEENINRNGEKEEDKEVEKEVEFFEKSQVEKIKDIEETQKYQVKTMAKETEDSEISDYDTLIETQTDMKSCKTSSKKLKLDKLVYAYVELYDESNGGTVLTITYNAKHLKPGDYVNVYDLRTQAVNDAAHQFLEKNDMYRVIIIDKVKAKQKTKILKELSVNSSNIETMKKLNEDELFKEKLLSRCRELENIHL